MQKILLIFFLITIASCSHPEVDCSPEKIAKSSKYTHKSGELIAPIGLKVQNITSIDGYCKIELERGVNDYITPEK